ncbi:hypothetical protein MUK42_16596 [Musa troglodytarum]|uniref:Uncharacterized protein n=1 Tax=Musa troglodytarum TaxID=320322 RepID=A0A9E7HK61_9LILI|nr:hypothetical protein MUK42_16596 [Musa troglodytarum]URE32608.1 hypothetical protein MUK42_16596 [Musa troglodytarum]
MKGKVVCSSECKKLQTLRSLYSHQGMDGNAVDEVPSSSSKQTKETHEKVNSETMNSSINDAESANDVNSTKVAAMKAAELVNKNLEGFGGVGYLSTDQKKKLLWGNKKKSASEESSSCWDFHLFPNQECQENFNRLMVISIHQLFYNHFPCSSWYVPTTLFQS